MFRSLALFLIVTCSLAVAGGQTPDTSKDKATKAPNTDRQRDIPFPAGVNLQFLIKELGAGMNINVLFDPESRLEMRNVRIELRNVTLADAINAILLQEGLVFEHAGPKTILISSRLRGNSLPQIGVGLTHLTPQLNDYFGVKSGILINSVSDNSPAAIAGLKAGDVIVELDGTLMQGALGLYRAISEKIGTEVSLKIVRERKPLTVTFTPEKGLK
jgi:membrane-associated protease RseP (regulator of RpoE activity)